MQNNKGTGKVSKSAVQVICDAIFKVVDHRIKELDSKWTKQIKGDSNRDIATVSVDAGGKSGVLFFVPVNLGINDWKKTSDETYIVEVPSARVTKNMALVGCALSIDATGSFTGALAWEVATGKVTLITSTAPNGAVKGSLILRKQ